MPINNLGKFGEDPMEKLRCVWCDLAGNQTWSRCYTY